ncbi:hypothetical protein LEMLEM_LOCUS3623, partial [Lemmus lemmus]
RAVHSGIKVQTASVGNWGAGCLRGQVCQSGWGNHHQGNGTEGMGLRSVPRKPLWPLCYTLNSACLGAFHLPFPLPLAVLFKIINKLPLVD